MGVRILSDQYDDMAVLYDSVTETAFGPIIRSTDEGGNGATEVAEAFLVWLDCDARERRADEIRSDHAAFMAEIERDGWDAVVGEIGYSRLERDSESGQLIEIESNTHPREVAS